MRHASHLASLRPELDAAWAATKKALQGRPQSEQMVQYAAQVRAILQREKCNPLKSIAITLAQIPLFITMVLSVRQMVNSGRCLAFIPNHCARRLIVLPAGTVI